MTIELERSGVTTSDGVRLNVEVTGLAHHSRVPRNIALTLVLGLMALGLREGFRRA